MTDICPIDNLDKILLATDGSEFCEGAVREALYLAKKCSGHLTAISVVEANVEFAAHAPDFVEKQEQEAKKMLEAIKAAAEASGVEAAIETHTGESVYQIIVDEARKNASEIIVMGRRGMTGIKRMAMGSVTARVVGHQPCDVLVVPRDCPTEFKTILTATDGSPHGEAAARDAIKIARKVGGSLIAFSSAASADKAAAAQENVNKVKQAADAEGVACETMTATGKPFARIVETAIEKRADLIVVGCHGKGSLGKLLMGHVTERVIGHSKCAVLVSCS
ncbi:MAG: universal stress protein [Actinobacteria bacterium]|nr:universal stress protein [Actinomycetota bacterium]